MANGRCSGEQWVREHYTNEVLAHLIRRTKMPNERRPEKWLIVVIDADKSTVQDRLNEFGRRILESKDERLRKCRVENENIARLIPKRSIETWILNLSEVTVDEKTPYKLKNHSWDRLISGSAAVLHEWVSGGRNLPDRCMPSLKLGIGEFRRLTA
jgi:tRNA uridine 5-carbamoylmethylation protein Kti12